MDNKDSNIKGFPFFLAWTIVLCTLMVYQGCATRNPFAPPEQSAHPDAYIDPASLGTMQFHGWDIQKNGPGSCRVCHGVDLEGTDTISGCYDCHFDLNGSRTPENSTWAHGTDPHSNLADASRTCNQCHSFMRGYGYAPETCHDCHGEGLNHLLGQPWLDNKSTDFHGNKNLTDCGNCHDLASKCTQCHFDSTGSKSPPGAGWNHDSSDDHDNTSAYIAVCNECHTLNRSYENPPSTCHDCHDVNHVLEQPWLDKKSADFHGDQQQSDCGNCHNLSTDCSQCHFDSAGSKTPPTGNWSHGSHEDHDDTEPYITTCNQCHTLNRLYSNPPSGCHDCH